MRHHLLDVAKTEREAEVQPDSVLNHGRWEAVSFVGDSRHWGPRKANNHGPYQRLGSIGLTAPLHPTVKPVGLVADAILDVTQRDEVVLDAFLGSGTTLIACERVDRRFVGLDIDPAYVDLALRRWRTLTGEEPIRLSDGRRFSDLEVEAAQ
jgi:hypothetical protein